MGRQEEAAGRPIRANLRFAAAAWLDPKTIGERDRITAQRPTDLPARLRRQPMPGYRELVVGKRHWEAWAMKKRRPRRSAFLDGLRFR